jgi:hypothetical protein
MHRAVSNTLQAPNGSYGSLFNASGWAPQFTDGAFVFGSYTQGVGTTPGYITIPTDGHYLLEWSLITDNAAKGIAGFTVNQTAGLLGGGINGLDLYAIGPVVNGGAYVGNASATVKLFAGDKVRLYGYGDGATLDIQDQNQYNNPPYKNFACRVAVTRLA